MYKATTHVLGYLPEDGTVFCEDPGVSGDPLDIGLAPHQEDDVTAGLTLDQGVPARQILLKTRSLSPH